MIKYRNFCIVAKANLRTANSAIKSTEGAKGRGAAFSFQIYSLGLIYPDTNAFTSIFYHGCTGEQPSKHFSSFIRFNFIESLCFIQISASFSQIISGMLQGATLRDDPSMVQPMLRAQ